MPGEAGRRAQSAGAGGPSQTVVSQAFAMSGAGLVPFRGRTRRRWSAGASRISHGLAADAIDALQAGSGWCSSIHEAPNRSRTIANRLANGVRSIFMNTSPPSVSAAYTRSASPSVSKPSVR